MRVHWERIIDGFDVVKKSDFLFNASFFKGLYIYQQVLISLDLWDAQQDAQGVHSLFQSPGSESDRKGEWSMA